MKIDRQLFHPDYKREPFWWEVARPSTKYSTDLPDQNEIFVVGSGYSGLSAALELARNGLTVTVVDALAFGEGASTRSGGGVSAGVNIGKGISGGPGQSKQFSAHKKLIEILMVESLAAFELLDALVEREGIKCDLERRGRFIGANTREHFKDMEQKAEDLNRIIGVGAKLIPRGEQHREVGSDFYYGGMVIEQAAKLHPSLFHKGLLDACHKAGVTLCSDTKVKKINGTVGKYTLVTSKGTSQAEQVIVATNGYTDNLSPNLRRRIVPISSQIIATEELPEDLAAELIPNGRTISESGRITSYYRLLPGNRRVMFGGRARFNSVPPDLSATLLHNMMTERWPQLKDVRITHSWSGLVAMTSDSVPHMGQENGIHFCTGCNGSGIAMMTYLGYKIAQRILQSASSETAYFSIDFPQIHVPFYSGKPWFLPMLGHYYKYLDHRDRQKSS